MFSLIYFFSFILLQKSLIRLNAVANYQGDFRKITDMKTDLTYQIEVLDINETRYGEAIRVSLRNFRKVFLSQRIYDLLSEDKELMQDLQNKIKIKKLGIHYLGGKGNPTTFVDL